MKAAPVVRPEISARTWDVLLGKTLLEALDAADRDKVSSDLAYLDGALADYNQRLADRRARRAASAGRRPSDAARAFERYQDARAEIGLERAPCSSCGRTRGHDTTCPRYVVDGARR